jgi:hypothetical protein
MDSNAFFDSVRLFADTDLKVERDKSTFLFSCRGQDILGKLVRRAGALFVEEGGAEYPAVLWISRRLGAMDRLAERLRSTLQASREKSFVSPAGQLLDALSASPKDEDIVIEDVLTQADDVLARRPAGTCEVLYLTSDAGEGKTTIIEELAIRRSEAFLKRESEWIVLPISLAGRPFLRFDDVIVATLANRFRFLDLFYQSLLFLVKYGFVVLAFDGFEEMFVETSSGEAISALGNLMSDLGGEGTILIAARSAYFEFRGVGAQTRIYESLGGASFEFSRIKIERWSKAHFVAYAKLRGHSEDEADNLYQVTADRLGGDHSILTRPVLVRRFLDIAKEKGSVTDLLVELGKTPSDYFSTFVRGLLAREASKWLDRSGGPLAPLLTIDQHEVLLAAIAREMWTLRSSSIPLEIVQTVAELFCESNGLSPIFSRQVLERVADHSLLRTDETARKLLRFDHEEFYYFFLGRALGAGLSRDAEADAADIMRRGALPRAAVEESIRTVVRLGIDPRKTAMLVGRAVAGEPLASFSSENAGIMVMELLSGTAGDQVKISNVMIPARALEELNMRAVSFEKCMFQRGALVTKDVEDVRVVSCAFEELTLPSSVGRVEGIEFDDTTVVHCLRFDGDEAAMFDPSSIRNVLLAVGLLRGQMPLSGGIQALVSDEATTVFRRALRLYQRSSEINSGTFTTKLGAQAPIFENEVLPALLRVGILKDVPYAGRGMQQRYRLTVLPGDLQRALDEAKGSFPAFCAAWPP